MSQAFPAPYIYPIDRANQNKALQQAGWGGMASYGSVAPAISAPRTAGGRGTINNYVGTFQSPTPTRPPIRYNPNSAYGVNNTGVDGTSMVAQPMAALTELLPQVPNTSYSPIGSNYGFNTNDQLAGMAGLREGRQGVGYLGSPMLGELPSGSVGADTGLFGGLLGKGKEAWNNNKDWLVGDKNSIGAIPLGLGLFNAFNQYTQGRESIKSMREQNALARESFALNKAGALASLEDQYNKRNSNDMYHRNPKLSYADNVAAASSKTLEDMKRFK